MEQDPIRLRPGKPPSAMRILATVLGANIVLVMISVFILGGVARQYGTDFSEGGPAMMAILAGFIGVIILAFVGIYMWVRRSQRIVASMHVGDLEMKIVSRAGDDLYLARSSAGPFEARPVQLYQTVDNQWYPAGPAVEVKFAEAKVVVANQSVRGRWKGDVPAVYEATFVCDPEDWERLLSQLDVDDEVVPYGR